MEPKEIQTRGRTWQEEILFVMGRMCRTIWRVDLDRDQGEVLWDAQRGEGGGGPFSWSGFLAGEGGALFTSLGHPVGQLSAPFLRKVHQEGERSLEHAMTRTGRRDLIFFFSQEEGGLWVYLLLQRRQDDLLREIVDLYVYNNCDYFIYLDARRNSYVMFGGDWESATRPPALCQDYHTVMTDYARTFVVPEDQELVIREMSLPRVIQQLEEKKVHVLYAGVTDPVLGYQRKKVEFRWFDRSKGMIILTRTDITAVYLEEQQRQQELQEALRQAQTDSLTGLLNYQGLRGQISAALSSGKGRGALLFLDLDDFKQVNDTYGHPAGDALLRQVAQVLEEETREGDLTGRVGGDEFIVYLDGVRSRAAAEWAAQRICGRCGALALPGEEAVVSCSVGVAMAPEDGARYEDLVEAADQRAYRAKGLGKNQVCAQ